MAKHELATEDRIAALATEISEDNARLVRSLGSCFQLLSLEVRRCERKLGMRILKRGLANAAALLTR